MARGHRREPAPDAGPDADAMEPRGSMARVKVVEILGAVRLRTTRPEYTQASSIMEGAIVRVIPPADFDAEHRRSFADWMKTVMKAAHVHYTSPESKDRVVTKRARARAGQNKSETLNEAVEAMLKDARTEDPARLRELVQRFLGEAGA